MRVLHSCFQWLPVTQRWIWVQIASLPPRIQSSVVTSRLLATVGVEWPDVRVARAFGREIGDLPRLLRRPLRRRFLRRAARETGARVVHSHFGHLGWEDRSPTVAAGLRHVVTFYGYDVVRLPRGRAAWRRRYRELFGSVDRVLCEGPFMARTVGAQGCPEAKLRVHHLGVELDRIPFAPRRPAPGEPLRVLMAATFVEKKGLPFGARAVARCARHRPVLLTVIGDASPATGSLEEKRRLLEAIADEGIERDVRLLGFVDHDTLVREMREHHLFLQPSVHAADGDCEGGAPVSLIEAAATGMAIVSTTHCDIPEVVVHERTGWLAPERDVEALTRGLLWWATRPEWESTLAAGRRRIEEQFDAAKQGVRLAAIYDEVVGGPATERASR